MSCDQFDKKSLAQNIAASSPRSEPKKHKTCLCDCRQVKRVLAEERRQRLEQEHLESLDDT